MKRTCRLPRGTVSAAALMLGANPAVMVGLGAALGLLGPGLDANGQWAEQRLKSFGFTDQAAGNPVSLAQGRDGALYGTTLGSYSSYGPITIGPAVVFTLSTNGSGFTVLHSFEDGANLNTVVQGRDGAWYGTTQNGGTNYTGTVFKLNADGTGYTVLHSFTGNGGDGARPWAGVAQGSDGAWYGTTIGGGSNGGGTVFKLNADGTGYAVLHHFGSSNGDGLSPSAALVQGSDSALYGTTGYGGTNGFGAVFKLNTDGTGYKVLHSFTGNGGDGAYPDAGLIQGHDGALYGRTRAGGTNGAGTVFKLNTGGSGYAVLHSFQDFSAPRADPNDPLVQGSDGALYGTTYGGNGGTIFKLSTDGTGYAVLHTFTNNSADGAHPSGGLVQGSDGAMYGATVFGGGWEEGVVFKLNGDGATYTMLYGFSSSGGDGASPLGALVQGSDGALFGTTSTGGTNGSGTVFRLNTDGTGYKILYEFTGTDGDGLSPQAGMIQGNDGTLYGTTTGGGTNGNGTVFRLNTDGTGYKVLHAFTGSGGDGANPRGGLVQGRDGVLYGTTSGGGATNSDGTLFRLNTDGTGYKVLHAFTGSGGDGAYPNGALVQGSDGMLYGTTGGGGTTNADGTVFRLNTDGTSYTLLHSFTGNGGDGAWPEAGLVKGSDGALYGTTGSGTVFKLNAYGTGYSVLYYFSGSGAFRSAGLVQGGDGMLYGATDTVHFGGSNVGVLFQLNTNGTGYNVLCTFTGSGGDGISPNALVQGNDGALYGTTQYGGDLNLGTVFRFGPVPPPQVTQLGRSEGGDIQITVSGAPNLAWRVEVATNLTAPVTWAPLATVPFTNGPVQLSDPGATNSPSRFYRAVWP